MDIQEFLKDSNTVVVAAIAVLVILFFLRTVVPFFKWIVIGIVIFMGLFLYQNGHLPW